MGTRADFYVGRGEDAEWIGSIAWDGYPQAIDDSVKNATDEAGFRGAVETFMRGREDATKPEMGWPWPWDTSHTTDYAYAFDGGAVHASSFGSEWFDPKRDEDEEHEELASKAAVFPNMASRKRMTLGARSGVIVVSG
jgi:hypothetical protein